MIDVASLNIDVDSIVNLAIWSGFHHSGGTMSPEDIESIGRELFGDRWRNRLAIAIDIDRAAVTHWMNGKYRVSKHVAKDIRELLMKHRQAMKNDKIEV